MYWRGGKRGSRGIASVRICPSMVGFDIDRKPHGNLLVVLPEKVQ
jgi:hypothetical protein